MFATPYSRYIAGTLPWYSVLIVIGICAAVLVAAREEKRLGLPKDTTVDLALWVIPFGIVGARLYYVAFAWDVFKNSPLSILKIWEGGVAIYGGIIGGLVAGLIFSRVKKIPAGKLADMVAPGLALAQAIGRWGNYFNMEAYGAAVTDPKWQFFPAAVLIPSLDGGSWHMATFFYESMWNLLVFAALMLTRRRMRRDGDVFLWYAALYGAGRFVIEGLRTDSLMSGSLRVSQLLSIALCAGVGVVFLLRMFRGGNRMAPLLILAAAALLIPAAQLLPIHLTLRHLLTAAVLTLASILAYTQMKPSRTEDTPCPPHP